MDNFVAEQVIQVLAPASLELSLAAEQALRAERAQLEEHLYGWDETVQSNAIEFLIHGLRKKLGSTVIENVRGVGWRMGTPREIAP